MRRYIEETGLPFNILIDESRDVSRRTASGTRIGLDAWNIARPALFLIDPDRQRSATRSSGTAQEEFPSHEEIMSELRTGD